MTTTGTSRPNPYIGPRAFPRGQPLYGRDREIKRLLDLMIAERIVLLYSPSGAGKTSLLEAALIPRLEEKERGREWFQVRPVMRVSRTADVQGISVSNRYVFSALLSLEKELPPSEQQMSLPKLAGMTFGDYLQQRWPTTGTPDDEVLIFDQFEEILTLDPTDREAKIDFFTQVGDALRNERHWALFSMREDYVTGLDPYLRLIPTRLGARFRLDLLEQGAALEAIQKPANKAGVPFTNDAAKKLLTELCRVRIQGLDNTIEEKTGLYIEPMQLQIVCLRLWKNLPEGASQIVEKDIDEIGIVDEALSDYYAEQVAAIARETGVRERGIRDWFDRCLITNGIRGQVLQGPSQGLDSRAIKLLEDAYLVRAERRRHQTWYELAHDRLIEPIQENNAVWVGKNLSTLQRQAAIWENERQRPDLLLRGQALVEAKQWATDHTEELTLTDRAFLAASQDARTADEREQRNNQHIRWANVTIFSLFSQAIQQERRATSRELAAAAISNLDVDPELSILLALHAVSVARSTDDAVLNQAQDALQRAVQTSRVRLTLPGHEVDGNRFYIRAVAFSPDGTRLATAGDAGTAQVWDATTGAEVHTLDHGAPINSVAFRDATRLVTAGADKLAIVWDVASGDEVFRLRGHTDQVKSVAFSPDGTRLATASWDRTVKLWDAATGAEVHTLDHGAPINSVAFRDATRLVTAGADKLAIVWDVASGDEVFRLRGHTDQVESVAFSPDGTRLATASLDRTVKLWDAATGAEVRTFSGHMNSVFGIAFDLEGRYLASASADGMTKLWEVTSGKEFLTLSGHSMPVFSVAFSPDGTRLATASWDGTARVWDIIIGHADRVTSVSFDRDGARLATASYDKTVKIWEVVSGKELRTLSDHEGEVNTVTFSPDGTRLATASSDKTVKIWDADSGELLRTLPHPAEVNDLVFSPDGMHLATAVYDNTAILWKVDSGEKRRTFSGHTDWVYGVAFSPDGTRLATSSLDGTKVWDIESGRPKFTLDGPPHGHTDRVFQVAFSPDGRLLATASLDRTVKLWNAKSGKLVRTLSGFTYAVHRSVFNRDGTRLAAASWDRHARVWDVATGKELLTFTHAAGVNDVAFSPDGRLLATATLDKSTKAHLYILDMAELTALARTYITRVPPNLTREECQQYLHQDQCPPMP